LRFEIAHFDALILLSPTAKSNVHSVILSD